MSIIKKSRKIIQSKNIIESLKKSALKNLVFFRNNIKNRKKVQ